jgi:MYXO-CTERM domain-containing protein
VPAAGVVADGTGADIDFQSSLVQLDANWAGFTDPQTGVVKYEWAIGTTSGAADIQAFTDVGTATSASVSSIPLISGTIYFVTVRATNAAGLTASKTSDGVKVDASPPNQGTVVDGPGADIDTQTSLTTLSASWSGFFDADSSITGYEWAVGTSAGATDVQGFVSVGLATSGSGSSFSLAGGTTYYVTVRATNGAGLTSTASSDGVTVTVPDGTPPVAGTVNDGAGADVDTQASTSTISANWSGFSDPESGITRYDWAVGTAAGGTDVQAFTPVGTATSASNAGLSLGVGTTCYVTVRATNGAGLTATATSDGVTVPVPDSTPPVAGTVNDGIAGADVDSQGSTTSLSANWSGFSDPESGITRYDWAIGTAAGAGDVQAFTSVGTSTAAAATGLTLANGTTYYVTVRATNGAGLTSTAVSDGVTVSVTTPAQPTASPEAIDFGSVAVGNGSSAHPVVVQNGSTATWNITSIVTDNPEFVLDTTGFPASLGSGQSAALQLTFHPVTAGVRTGALRISFSGATAPTVVSLSGTGVAEEGPGGCGCASGGGGPVIATAALLALALAARRRRR